MIWRKSTVFPFFFEGNKLPKGLKSTGGMEENFARSVVQLVRPGWEAGLVFTPGFPVSGDRSPFSNKKRSFFSFIFAS
jgi:hypothetical protein